MFNDNLEKYWHESMAKHKVNHKLALCFIAIVNNVWKDNYKHIRIDELAEDAKGTAIIVLLENWRDWNGYNLQLHYTTITKNHMAIEIDKYFNEKLGD